LPKGQFLKRFTLKSPHLLMSVRHPSGFTVSAPGRVCLFGEHQDYLLFPVIACAISLRLTIDVSPRTDTILLVEMPDVGSSVSCRVDEHFGTMLPRDYIRSGINVMRRRGFTFSRGYSCRVRGNIPIAAGTSSSSALAVAWVNVLSLISDQSRPLDPEASCRFAHEAEVVEFGEPGGMMDHVASAFGGVLALTFSPALSVHRLHPELKAFVLGDSGEPKQTHAVLSGVKSRVSALAEKIAGADRAFTLGTMALGEIDRYRTLLGAEEMALLRGTLRNRDITREAREMMSGPGADGFGPLLSEHHAILRDALHISTPKIERMIDAAMHAGARGAKINGSGGGGCMFAYAPDDPETVAAAIAEAGGRPYIVLADKGVEVA
jgi:galactokinase